MNHIQRRVHSICLVLGIVALAAVTLTACSPDEKRYDILALSPEPVQQGNVLRIEGTGFGNPVEGVSGVAIGTSCAPVLFWDDKTIAVQIPAGIGTGIKQLRLARGDGGIRTTDVLVTGDNLAAGSVTTECGAVFTTLPPPDVVEPDADTDVPSDTPPDLLPDIPPDSTLDVPVDEPNQCELVIGVGACTSASDCELQIARPEFLWEVGAQCTLECLDTIGEDYNECVRLCYGDRTRLSDECRTCYAGLAQCTRQNCTSACFANPFSPECGDCVREDCTSTFEICSGTELNFLP